MTGSETRKRGVQLFVALSLLLLQGCQSDNAMIENMPRYALLRPNLDFDAFKVDVDQCVEEISARGEKYSYQATSVHSSGGGLAGFATAVLLTTFANVAAEQSARYSASLAFIDECLYQKGYRDIRVPKNLQVWDDIWHDNTHASIVDKKYNSAATRLRLIKEGKVQELITLDDQRHAKGN